MRRLLSLLIVALVLARGAIPAGFMPVASSDGALQIVICSVHGAQSIAAEEDGKPSKPQDAGKSHPALCPFAATTLAAYAPEILSIAVPFEIVTRSEFAQVASVATTGPANGVSARGPPIPQA
jgi:hypothetical protein